MTDAHHLAAGNTALLTPEKTVDEAQSIAIRQHLTPRIEAGLRLLLEAAEWAGDVGIDIWQFAVESSALYQVGVTVNECRWLVLKRLVNHGLETTDDFASQRKFQTPSNLAFPAGTCFVLTDEGIAFMQSLNRRDSDTSRATVLHSAVPAVPVGLTLGDCVPAVLAPTWDCDLQQLRIGRAVVKQFKVPDANQEAILAAFQEKSWRDRIDDPLPRQHPKQLLHDTIKALNRNQKKQLVHFYTDGPGAGVRWSFTNHSESDQAGSTSSNPEPSPTP
jgi:hypothetical protein